MHHFQIHLCIIAMIIDILSQMWYNIHADVKYMNLKHSICLLGIELSQP